MVDTDSQLITAVGVLPGLRTILLGVGGMVLGGILYVLFRLVLKPLGLWDDSWTGSSGD